MLAALLVAGTTFRRLVGRRHLVLALLAGALCGAAVLALPAPGLALDTFSVLVPALVAVVVLPLVASLPTDDRLGGYEQLQGSRPVSSLSLAAGRLFGGFVAAGLLALVLAGVAGVVASRVEVPEVVAGTLDGTTSTRGGGTWRFPVPKGAQGPFDLLLDTHLPLVAAADLTVDSRRGNGTDSAELTVRPWRRQVVSLSDLAPERGDLYVTLRPSDGLVLVGVPQLRIGQRRLTRDDMLRSISRGTVMRLAFALLAVVAAASAFHFETACLTGLVALTRMPRDAPELWTTVGLLLVFCVVATALVRRQVLR